MQCASLLASFSSALMATAALHNHRHAALSPSVACTGSDLSRTGSAATGLTIIPSVAETVEAAAAATMPTSELTPAELQARQEEAEAAENHRIATEPLSPRAEAQRQVVLETIKRARDFSSTTSWLRDDYGNDAHTRCEMMVTLAASNGDAFDIGMSVMKLYGCPFRRENIMCMPCTGNIHGGYIPGTGVLICENRISNAATLARTLTHELVHAFDDCRANVDWTSCEQQACSEACVRRRAILSVQANPNCRGARAVEAVEKVWNPCHFDNTPFPDIQHTDAQVLK
ncbi:hypothetical protein CAOG_001615 [Capsaspora owczarzaki ATCC 30864]|uniref:Mitochondrial inner membrane protease ATP23 n=1 Tax=Capsaspora owczarzaki (strain ATCC 30864) TaxID=595528 RepID=A0A0D2VJV0_CAPO3|nr:hypothetical protein CAOG_001615 [Capsaspora owczarzaki ATCC 30864]